MLTTYSGAGYVQDLTTRKNSSTEIINYMFDNLWIMRGTRAVFIDFTVYNANINLFCVVRYEYYGGFFFIEITIQQNCIVLSKNN
jgi:hypothetical protein